MWVYRLIRRHHCESGYVVQSGQLRQKICSKRVVLDRLDWIALHERHMFEGCGVDYGFGLEFLKYLPKQRAVADGAHDRGNGLGTWKGTQIQFDLVEIAFGVIQKNEQARPELDNRFGKGRTD